MSVVDREALKAPTDSDIAARALAAVALFEEQGWGGWVELVSYNDKVALFEAARRFGSVLEGEAIWLCRSNDKGAFGSLDRCEWTSGPDHFERCGRVVVVPIGGE